MNEIVKILMERERMSESSAKDYFDAAVMDLNERLEDGEMPMDIRQEWFGLEPDYLDYLI